MPALARRRPNFCRPGLLPLFAVITCWVLGSTAGASEQSTESAIVSYRDLDLSRRDDREILRLRIRQAAAKVCRDLYFAEEPLWSEFAGCVDRSTDKALAVVNSRPRRAQVASP